MTTAPARHLLGPNGQALNGSARPAAGLPFRVGAWRPVRPVGDIGAVWERDQTMPPDPEPQPAAPAEPTRDPVAEAEAAAIRLKAEAEAKAIETKAVEEAERQRIANERARMKLEKDKADHDERIAAANRRREAAEREARAAREAEEATQAAAAAEQAKVEASATSWRKAAITFAIVCGIVALPVQMHAFCNPHELWLLAAPFMLEGGAWVVNRGARAAVDEHRPHWHYRLIAWTLAFIAATINFAHGIQHFDVPTAVGTAFASLAGPGVWDLHEHGRIRLRDGKLTRAQRRQKKREAKRIAAAKAATEEKLAAEKEAAEKARAETAKKLAAERAEHFPKVWAHAVKLAAALGETTVTEGVWKRAYKDIEGTEPFESVDIIRTRNAAERRAAAARSEAPGSTPSKVTASQIVPQVPTRSKRGLPGGPKVRGVRRSGDVPRFSQGARNQAAIAAKGTGKAAGK